MQRKALLRVAAVIIGMLLAAGCAGQAEPKLQPQEALATNREEPTIHQPSGQALPSAEVLAGSGQNPSNQAPSLGEKDFAMQGITADLHEADVIRHLGKPTETGYVGGIGAKMLVYAPTGLAVVTEPNSQTVHGWFLMEDSQLETSRGIRVGSPKEAVLEAYGPPFSGDSTTDKLIYFLPEKPELRLTFHLWEGKVIMISAGIVPFLW